MVADVTFYTEGRILNLTFGYRVLFRIWDTFP